MEKYLKLMSLMRTKKSLVLDNLEEKIEIYRWATFYHKVGFIQSPPNFLVLKT